MEIVFDPIKIVFDTEAMVNPHISFHHLQILLTLKEDLRKHMRFTKKELKYFGVLVIVFYNNGSCITQVGFPDEYLPKLKKRIESFNFQPSLDKVLLSVQN